MGAPRTSLSFEEFEQLPDQPGKRELLKGELIELPPAEFRRQQNLPSRLPVYMETGYKLGAGADGARFPTPRA